MFQWNKTISAINIPACKVVNLFRSMRDLQLALPGVPAQQASAFLCQYRVEDGVSTVAVFHLHKSQMLTFYFSDPPIVPEQKTDSILDQGLNFVESMGFLMTDQDIHLLDEADQEMLWASLPIKTGLSVEEADTSSVVVATKRPVEKSAAKLDTPKFDPAKFDPAKFDPAKFDTTRVEAVPEERPEPSVALERSRPAKVEPPVVEPMKVALSVEPKPDVAENVDDLLAAVEAMRAKRPGLRARKSPPSAEEMGRRRLHLRETVGRILASL